MRHTFTHFRLELTVYRALVHDEPDFPTFFQLATPIDVIERLRIGSRPAKRRAMRAQGRGRVGPRIVRALVRSGLRGSAQGSGKTHSLTEQSSD